MKTAITHLGMVLLLCLPVVATAQIRYTDPANRNLAKQIGESVLRTIKTKEPKWKLELALESEFGFHPYLKKGRQEVNFSIYVYDSPDEASKQLQSHSRWSSLTAESPLTGIGDEAFYISHRYFSWIGARKGRMLVEVHGPPGLIIIRRFAQYALDEMALVKKN